MKRNYNEKGVRAYLNSCGALATNDMAMIAQAKLEYRRCYKRDWRNNRRKIEKEYTISFKPKELAILRRSANEHKRACTKFIKDAVFAYIKQTYLVPDIDLLFEIKQQLVLANTYIRKLFEQNIIPAAIGKYVLLQFNNLEQQILEKIEKPKLSNSDR